MSNFSFSNLSYSDDVPLGSWPAGIAASHYSHVHYFVNREGCEAYDNINSIVEQLVDVGVPTFKDYAVKSLLSYLREHISEEGGDPLFHQAFGEAIAKPNYTAGALENVVPPVGRKSVLITMNSPDIRKHTPFPQSSGSAFDLFFFTLMLSIMLSLRPCLINIRLRKSNGKCR